MKLDKILYPTDFSEHSLAALPYARELAKEFGSEIHCLYVVDEAYQYWMGPGETALPVITPIEEVMETSRQQMEKFVGERFGGGNERVIQEVRPGRPFVEILKYAREKEIDLIVIATHGRGALASMLLGSVTEKVVRKSRCPVLTVRHPEYKFEML